MNKLGKKLVLSSLSLGLAVVTLSTTTFAWYTSNTSVNATIIGSTGETTDSSLTIASTESGPFVKTAAGHVEGGHDGSTLRPLQVVGSNLVGLGAGDGYSTAGKTAGDTDYLQFSVYVKSTAEGSTTVYLENITVTNTTSSLPESPILAAYKVGGSGADVWQDSDVGQSYAIDATRALSMHVTSGDVVTLDKGYSIGEFSAGGKEEKKVQDSFDALDYYNAVMGTSLTRGTNVSEELQQNGDGEAITVAELTGNTAKKITFTIWLDGWDKACFDACQKQTFSITFSLTSSQDSVQVSKKAA